MHVLRLKEETQQTHMTFLTRAPLSGAYPRDMKYCAGIPCLRIYVHVIEETKLFCGK